MNGEVNTNPFLEDEVPPEIISTPLTDALAEQTVGLLKQEADRYIGIDPHRSLEFADRIIAIGQARGDTRQWALGLMTRGDALRFFGKTSEAWEALDLAGQLFRKAGDEVGWARTRIGRLYLSMMLNRISEGLLEAEQARKIFIRYGEREKLLRVEIQTAYVENHLGEQTKALQRFQSALAIADELGDHGRPFRGILFTNIGSTLEGLGDLRQAREYYERAGAFFTEQGETLHLAIVEANLGHIDQANGNYRQALRYLTSSIERASGHSDLETTKIKWHLYECYLGLNRIVEARELARQIVEDYRHLQDAFELARALLQLATIEAELTNFDAAHVALDEAEKIFTSLDADTWIAKIWLHRGRIALKQDDAATAYDRAREAAAVFKSAGQEVNLGMAALLEGQASVGLGDFPAAREAGKIALHIAQQHNFASLRHSAYLLLGQVYEAHKAIPRALRYYEAAVATTERIQRALTITLRPGFLEDKTDAWRALIRLHLQEGKTGKAFEVLERSKSQVLLGYLANREHLRWAREETHSRELIEELERLRGEYQWYYRLAHEGPEPPDHHGPMEPQQALVEVKTRERKMRALTEQLYLQSAEGKAPNPVRPACLINIQGALEADTLLVEFYNDGHHVWAFTLGRESVDVYQLPVTVQEINRLVAQLQLNMTAALTLAHRTPAPHNLTQLAQRILQRLYTFLIEPLAHLRVGRHRLVIVPYGVLHYLPFHLLYDGSAYLIERHEIVILPAAGLALQPGPVRKPGALILTHSWDGRLPHTLAEGQVVQRIFGGSLWAEGSADRTVLMAQPTQILHVCAHGQYRLDQPDLSYIQLSDGQLYADDLLQQDMSYELVTLSACETGRANVAGGEELIGLGRGFLYAGAGALVLSLWPVPDEITVRWMEVMYQALREGASKAAALKSAQMTILAEDPKLHPAFWGAFQLVGNPSPLSILSG
jgi:CHAT domain-containing protein